MASSSSSPSTHVSSSQSLSHDALETLLDNIKKAFEQQMIHAYKDVVELPAAVSSSQSLTQYQKTLLDNIKKAFEQQMIHAHKDVVELPAAVSSSQSWSYDVFLSFRGEDTRKTFVDHLYVALDQQGILTYKDDVTLPRGESISPSLLKAIEESQAAIIIFSKNYANSTWCLDELMHIMKCRDERKQLVMPVFYDVEPTEVQKHKRTYKEAFEKHEQENKEKVECWRKALVEASKISGWEIKHIANGHEAQVIKQIVDKISQSLKLVTLEADENLIGIRTRIQALKSELQLESGGVRMVGIWGVGGGGKTTLASSIYEEISSMYDGCCFVDNIRVESSNGGLKKLQEKVFSDVLKHKLEVRRVEEGRRLLKARLCHKKVLLVLDDVDRRDQLEALVGSHDWFGEGSRIIITTRDKHILNAHRVDVTHQISLLSRGEAINLFFKHAHRDFLPMEGFEQLSMEVVRYAGGLPLALAVLGSFLCDKNVNQWRSAIDRLKEIPNEDILGKLKISFDGLEEDQKGLFLDMACFYRRKKKDRAMEKLHACGFHPDIGIEVLRQKALIVITEDGCFDMHDLVQEMAHHIVRGKHPKNLEKHSRVWKREEVRRILAMDATTKLVNCEAIDLPLFVSYEESQRFLQVAGNMPKLRWIDLYCDEERDEIALPLPEKFPPREICWLNIWGCIFQKQLWEGYKYLPNLTHMELKKLPNLIKIPDFTGLANLETFKLGACPCLEEIHPSIGRLESLVFVSIFDCERLRKFPSITRIKNLETLRFTNCPTLEIMSEEEEMEKLGRHVFDLGNTITTGKQQVAAASLSLSSCIEQVVTNFFLNCLPHHGRLRFSHNALRKMNLSWCSLGDEEIGSDVWELPNLEQLDLSVNPLISQLDFRILRLPRLKRLDVIGCFGLVELSELPSTIAVVRAADCWSLESIGDISKCKWLWNVSVDGSNKLDQHCVDTLIESMLQGNAIKDHYISVVLGQHQFPSWFEGRFFRVKTFRLQLPDDWYNDFCGFLICFVTNMRCLGINIIIEQEDPPPPFDLSQQQQQEESDDEAAVEPPPTFIYGEDTTTCVGYVSFGLLRHPTTLNSSYNIISATLKEHMFDETYDESACVGIELIRSRKIKSDEVQTTTTHSSQFWDEKIQDTDSKTFTIQQQQQRDSKSCIEIKWNL